MEKQKEREKKKISRYNTFIEKISMDLLNSIEEIFKYEKFVLKYMGEDTVKGRLYFMRHGETLQARDENKECQTLDAELTEDMKKEIKTKGRDLIKILGKGNRCILYDGNTVRTRDTGELLGKAMNINSVLSIDKGLETSDKTLKHKKHSKINAASNTADFIVEFTDKLYNKANFNIFFSIHRGNIGAIEQIFLMDNIGPTIVRSNKMKNLEIREIDLGINNETISHIDRKNILFINIYNYNGILKELENETGLLDQIQQFKSQELQIWELQNYINAYFRSKPKLYKKYLLSDSYELRIFCIANLIKNGEFEFFLDKLVELIDKESETNIINFIETILSICEDDENQQKRITSLLAEKQKIPVGVKFDKLELFANYEKRVKIEIRNIRKKTLDEKLQRGENVILPIGFQNDTYKNLDELIRSDDKILIEGEAGSGKSTKLLEIMEYLAPKDEKEKKDENIYFPVYLNLGIENIDNLETRINEIQGTLKTRENIKFVYLFDALDEAKWTTEEKREFINLVKKLKGTVVITSRPDNIKESKKGLKELELKPLDKEQIEQYIKNHLGEEQQKVWEQWRDKEFIKGIESNPLMLSIICNLLEEGEDIANITNIKGLYDKIVDKRLLAWEKAKKRNASLFLEERKKLLGEIAYNSLDPLQAIDKNSLDKIIHDNNNYRRAVSLEDENGDLIVDYVCLNLIFKKSDYGNYEFVHESFREYFLAEYLKGLSFDNLLELIFTNNHIFNKIVSVILQFGDEKLVDKLVEIYKLDLGVKKGNFSRSSILGLADINFYNNGFKFLKKNLESTKDIISFIPFIENRVQNSPLENNELLLFLLKQYIKNSKYSLYIITALGEIDSIGVTEFFIAIYNLHNYNNQRIKANYVLGAISGDLKKMKYIYEYFSESSNDQYNILTIIITNNNFELLKYIYEKDIEKRPIIINFYTLVSHKNFLGQQKKSLY